MKQVAKRIAFALVPAVVIIGGAEMGLQGAGWPKLTEAFEHNEPFWLTPVDLENKSYHHKEIGGSFTVSTNTDGLRAPLHSRSKPDGTFRIMTLGCSTTFGWGVDDAESFPARLEQLILDGGYTHVEVINGMLTHQNG